MMLEEIASSLRAEKKLNEEKYKKVKLGLRQYFGFWGITILALVLISIYKHDYIHTIIVTIFGAILLWQLYAGYTKAIFLYNFGVLVDSRIIKIFFFHPGIIGYRKVACEFKDKHSKNQVCTLGVPRRIRRSLSIGDTVQIIYAPDNPREILYYAEENKSKFEFRS